MKDFINCNVVFSALLLAQAQGAVWVPDGTSGVFGTIDNTTNVAGFSTVNGTIGVSNITFQSDQQDFFSSADGTSEAIILFEETASFTTVTVAASVALTYADLLFHNVINNGGSPNYVGNFQVTFADGFIATNAIPSLTALSTSAEFNITENSGEFNVAGAVSAFAVSETFISATLDPDGAGSAVSANYFSALSSSEQASGILGFVDTVGRGGITEITYDWVSLDLAPTNRAFTSIAGAAVPEPSTFALVLAPLVALLSRRRR